MTTYPLATLAPTITSAGITAPSYADTLGSLVARFQAVYGSDVSLDPSTQDYAMLAIFALACSDTAALAIAVYNQFSPATAFGNGLSSVVKINGIARLIPTNSTADILIVGQAQTPIFNGAVGDGVNRWNLPGIVIIPDSGSVVVTATCSTVGAVPASAGAISQILTPTLGWQSATNANAATLGQPVESDATLRQRQASSTGLPAQTVLESIVGNIEDISGVIEVRPYENVGTSTDANGLPPHAISLVVSGGDVVQIATVIAQKKAPGVPTFGTTSETVIDQVGVSNTINFFRPTNDRIIVNVAITALAGYVSTTAAAVVAAVVAYVNALPIGTNVDYFNVASAAALNNGPLAATYKITSLTMADYGSTLAMTDVPVPFNHQAALATADVAITVS